MATEIVQRAAKQFTDGNSDKIWAMVLGRNADGTYTLASCWGKRGSSLQSKVETLGEAAATKQFAKKLAEKVADGYMDVDWTQYGILPTLLSKIPDLVVGDASTAVPAASTATPAQAAIVVSHVLPIPARTTVETYINDPQYGVTEKVNGVRFTICFDGTSLTGYNRRGQPQPSVPDAAQALAALGVPFWIDGERMEGADAGRYVMFDVLEWNGQSVRDLPYRERIVLLANALQQANLVEQGGATLARNTSYTRNGLALLIPAITAADKAAVVDEIKVGGGEGFIMRTLNGMSRPGDTRDELKFKLEADIDVIAIDVQYKAGRTGGAVVMGLIRPDDGAIIAVGAVRSGLTDASVAAIAKRIEAGEQPVLKVSFLTARTVGIALVEPKTTGIRTDKLAMDCTTKQLIDVLGTDRAAVIAQAPAARAAVAVAPIAA